MKKTNSTKRTKKNQTAGPPELSKLLEMPATTRAKGKKNGATVASKPEPPTAAGEVPDWAKRAAARDTATEMASVPETTTPAPIPEPPTAPPTPKKGRAPKAAKSAKPAPKKAAAKPTPSVTPGSIRAIGDGWLESLRAAGHTPSTVSSYANDLAVAYEHFGEPKVAADLTEKEITAFNASKGVVKTRTGKAKAQPTILKTRRALRLALVWAEQKGLIKKAPFPAKTPA